MDGLHIVFKNIASIFVIREVFSDAEMHISQNITYNVLTNLI